MPASARVGDNVTVLDKLTYAGRRENLCDVSSRIRFVHGAIEDPEAVQDAVSGCEAIVNFAAETHVDRSIADPEGFIVTNMQGTHVLLEAARERGLRYLQVLPYLRARDPDLPRLEQLRPHQYPEKLILNALVGDPLPVYGDGRNVRNWLFVEDFARGIGHALAVPLPGRRSPKLPNTATVD